MNIKELYRRECIKFIYENKIDYEYFIELNIPKFIKLLNKYPTIQDILDNMKMDGEYFQPYIKYIHDIEFKWITEDRIIFSFTIEKKEHTLLISRTGEITIRPKEQRLISYEGAINV